jgi:sugar/nucleoside kinase (ribokinase family)
MSKHCEVISVCNALMDIVLNVSEEDIRRHGLRKGSMHLVDRPAQEALLAEFCSHEQVVELGGSSLNVIRALAQLGHRTSFVGVVADDLFGEKIRTQMHKLSITSHLASLPTDRAITGTCLSLVTPDAERTMVTHLGASRLYTRDDIPSAEIRGAKIFHFCGYQWDTTEQKDAVTYALQLAKKSDTLVSFDLADPFVVEHNRSQFGELVAEADVVFANEAEAKLLYGLSPEACAEKIASYNTIAVVKLGARGALIQQGSTVIRVGAEPTSVVDTTGAGDMFAGGFLHGLCLGLPLEVCGKAAALLASDVISRYGVRLAPEKVAAVKALAPSSRSVAP